MYAVAWIITRGHGDWHVVRLDEWPSLHPSRIRYGPYDTLSEANEAMLTWPDPVTA